MSTCNSMKASSGITCELPPLILHPFDDHSACKDLEDVVDGDEATNRYLQARYVELRMLCFIGKDLNRWLGQCVEFVSANQELAGRDLSESLLITQLLFDPPTKVVRKMRDWGVGNHQIIFSRALGLNTVYPHPPEPTQVSEALLRDFHVFADALFDARLNVHPVADTEIEFDFDVYASREYSNLLERGWTGGATD